MVTHFSASAPAASLAASTQASALLSGGNLSHTRTATMASIVAVLASVISVVGAIFAFKHITGAVDEFSKPLMDKCPSHVDANPILGFKFVDIFLCIVVPFFEKLRVNPSYIIGGGYLVTVAMVVNVLTSVEASRKRAPMLLTWLPVLAFFSQTLGISVAIPLLWIPSFLLFNAGDSSTKAAVEGKAIPVIRVGAIAVNSFFAMPVILAMGLLEGPILVKLITVFQFFPLVQPLFMLPFYGSTKYQASGHRAVQSLYYFTAGTAFMWHCLAVAFMLHNPTLLHKSIDLFTNHSGEDGVTYFFMMDGLILWAAALYFVLVDGGILPFILTALASPLLGPAAFSLYLASREGSIESAASSASSKKKSQ